MHEHMAILLPIPRINNMKKNNNANACEEVKRDFIYKTSKNVDPSHVIEKYDG